jgi:thioredoxin 1
METSMMEEIYDADFAEKTSQSGDILVLFYKEPCPYCKTMKGVIEKFSGKAPQVKIFIINGLENPESSKTMGVEGYPVIIFFKDGRLTNARQKGLTNPQGLLALWQTAGF